MLLHYYSFGSQNNRKHSATLGQFQSTYKYIHWWVKLLGDLLKLLLKYILDYFFTLEQGRVKVNRDISMC